MTQTHQRNYLANFILDTREYEQPIEKLVENLKEAIKSVGGKPGEDRNLGRQEFVRVTNKRHTGDIYLQIEFSGPPTAPAALQDSLRLDRTVKRLMVDNV